ncbi:hypothetical protein D3C71_1170520 [compost metagenome]
MVKIALLALIKPPPLMLIPEGLAIMTSAICPATSKFPSKREAADEFTSFRITRASPVAKNGLAATFPTVFVVAP